MLETLLIFQDELRIYTLYKNVRAYTGCSQVYGYAPCSEIL